MTRQVTDQLYIDLEYFTPEEYFTYVAEAQSAINSIGSLSCDAELIPGGELVEASGNWTAAASLIGSIEITKLGAAAISSQASITAVISHIEGADLQAFTNSNITTIVERIRSMDIDVSSTSELVVTFGNIQNAECNITAAFSPSISVRAIKVVAMLSEMISEFNTNADRYRSTNVTLENILNLSSQSDVSRDFSLDVNAQADLNGTITRIRDISSTQQVEFSLSISIDKIVGFEITQSSEFSVSAYGARERDIDLFAFTDASLLTNISYIATANVTASASSSLTANGGPIQEASVAMSVGSFVLVAGYGLLERPRQYTLYKPDSNNNIYIDTGTKKFGSGSLAITGNGYYQDYYSPDFGIGSNRFALETWIYHQTAGTTTGTKYLIRNGYGTGNYEAWNLSVTYVSNLPYLGFGWKDSTDTLRFTPLSGTALPTNQWVHVVVSRGNGRISIFQNGTRVATTTSNESGTWAPSIATNKPKFTILGASTSNVSVPAFRYDDVSFTVGWDKDYNASQTTITVPTTESRNWPVDTHYSNSQTKVLLHFNGNFNDDITADWHGAGALISYITSNISISTQTNGYANLLSNSSLSATISHIEGADLQAFTNCALSATVEKIKNVDTGLISEVTFNSDASIIADVNSQIESNTTSQAIALRIRDGSIATESIATQLTAVVKTGNTLVDLQAIATQEVTVSKIMTATETLSSEFNIDVNAIRAVDAIADSLSEFSQTIINSRTRDNFVATESIATQLTAVVRLAGLLVDDLSEFVVEVDAVVIRSQEILIESTTSSVVNNNRVRYGSTSLSNEFNIVSQPTSVKEFESALSAEFTNDIDAEKNVGTFAYLEAFAFELVAAVKQTVSDVDLVSTSSMVVTGSKTSDITLSIDNEFAVDVTAVKVTDVNSSMPIEFTQSANGVIVTEIIVNLQAFAFEVTAAVKVGDFVIDSNVVSTLSAQISVQRSGLVNAECEFNQLTNVNKLVGFSSSINMTSNVIATIGMIIPAQVNISSAMTFQATLRELRLNEIVYVIPGEIWTFEITSETRNYTIGSETRTYIIQGE